MFVVLAANASEPVKVNAKVLKAFNQTFFLAKDVVWQNLEKQLYQASFIENNIQVRAFYDESGNLLETIRYYQENQLPPNITAKVKAKYTDQNIFGVTEVSNTDAIKYLITLKDAKNWYMVKADAVGNLEQTTKYKRADID